MSDTETLQVYAARAQEYADLTDDANAGDPTLEAFVADLPAQARVLDLGCGPGASAERMARAGLRVDAYDAVPEMVELAKQNKGVTAKVAGFDDVSGTDIYDGIWANFSLLHAPREALPGHLQRIVKALKPGGVFHVALKSGTGSKRDALGRHYTYYREEELTALLKQEGLTVYDSVAGQSKGLDGIVAPWFALRARA